MIFQVQNVLKTDYYNINGAGWAVLSGQGGEEYKLRRYKWFTLAAFQKLRSGISPEFDLVQF